MAQAEQGCAAEADAPNSSSLTSYEADKVVAFLMSRGYHLTALELLVESQEAGRAHEVHELQRFFSDPLRFPRPHTLRQGSQRPPAASPPAPPAPPPTAAAPPREVEQRLQLKEYELRLALEDMEGLQRKLDSALLQLAHQQQQGRQEGQQQQGQGQQQQQGPSPLLSESQLGGAGVGRPSGSGGGLGVGPGPPRSPLPPPADLLLPGGEAAGGPVAGLAPSSEEMQVINSAVLAFLLRQGYRTSALTLQEEAGEALFTRPHTPSMAPPPGSPPLPQGALMGNQAVRSPPRPPDPLALWRWLKAAQALAGGRGGGDGSADAKGRASPPPSALRAHGQLCSQGQAEGQAAAEAAAAQQQVEVLTQQVEALQQQLSRQGPPRRPPSPAPPPPPSMSQVAGGGGAGGVGAWGPQGTHDPEPGRPGCSGLEPQSAAASCADGAAGPGPPCPLPPPSAHHHILVQLTQLLPRILPALTIKSRLEMLPLVQAIILGSLDNDTRQALTGLVMSGIASPDPGQRGAVVAMCAQLAAALGRNWASLEVLGNAVKLATSPSPERRMLAAEMLAALLQWPPANPLPLPSTPPSTSRPPSRSSTPSPHQLAAGAGAGLGELVGTGREAPPAVSSSLSATTGGGGDTGGEGGGGVPGYGAGGEGLGRPLVDVGATSGLLLQALHRLAEDRMEQVRVAAVDALTALLAPGSLPFSPPHYLALEELVLQLLRDGAECVASSTATKLLPALQAWAADPVLLTASLVSKLVGQAGRHLRASQPAASPPYPAAVTGPGGQAGHWPGAAAEGQGQGQGQGQSQGQGHVRQPSASNLAAIATAVGGAAGSTAEAEAAGPGPEAAAPPIYRLPGLTAVTRGSATNLAAPPHPSDHDPDRGSGNRPRGGTRGSDPGLPPAPPIPPPRDQQQQQQQQQAVSGPPLAATGHRLSGSMPSLAPHEGEGGGGRGGEGQGGPPPGLTPRPSLHLQWQHSLSSLGGLGGVLGIPEVALGGGPAAWSHFRTLSHSHGGGAHGARLLAPGAVQFNAKRFDSYHHQAAHQLLSAFTALVPLMRTAALATCPLALALAASPAPPAAPPPDLQLQPLGPQQLPGAAWSGAHGTVENDNKGCEGDLAGGAGLGPLAGSVFERAALMAATAAAHSAHLGASGSQDPQQQRGAGGEEGPALHAVTHHPLVSRRTTPTTGALPLPTLPTPPPLLGPSSCSLQVHPTPPPHTTATHEPRDIVEPRGTLESRDGLPDTDVRSHSVDTVVVNGSDPGGCAFMHASCGTSRATSTSTPLAATQAGGAGGRAQGLGSSRLGAMHTAVCGWLVQGGGGGGGEGEEGEGGPGQVVDASGPEGWGGASGGQLLQAWAAGQGGGGAAWPVVQWVVQAVLAELLHQAALLPPPCLPNMIVTLGAVGGRGEGGWGKGEGAEEQQGVGQLRADLAWAVEAIARVFGPAFASHVLLPVLSQAACAQDPGSSGSSGQPQGAAELSSASSTGDKQAPPWAAPPPLGLSEHTARARLLPLLLGGLLPATAPSPGLGRWLLELMEGAGGAGHRGVSWVTHCLPELSAAVFFACCLHSPALPDVLSALETCLLAAPPAPSSNGPGAGAGAGAGAGVGGSPGKQVAASNAGLVAAALVRGVLPLEAVGALMTRRVMPPLMVLLGGDQPRVQAACCEVLLDVLLLYRDTPKLVDQACTVFDGLLQQGPPPLRLAVLAAGQRLAAAVSPQAVRSAPAAAQLEWLLQVCQAQAAHLVHQYSHPEPSSGPPSSPSSPTLEQQRALAAQLVHILATVHSYEVRLPRLQTRLLAASEALSRGGKGLLGEQGTTLLAAISGGRQQHTASLYSAPAAAAMQGGPHQQQGQKGGGQGVHGVQKGGVAAGEEGVAVGAVTGSVPRSPFGGQHTSGMHQGQGPGGSPAQAAGALRPGSGMHTPVPTPLGAMLASPEPTSAQPAARNEDSSALSSRFGRFKARLLQGAGAQTGNTHN